MEVPSVPKDEESSIFAGYGTCKHKTEGATWLVWRYARQPDVIAMTVARHSVRGSWRKLQVGDVVVEFYSGELHSYWDEKAFRDAWEVGAEATLRDVKLTADDIRRALDSMGRVGDDVTTIVDAADEAMDAKYRGQGGACRLKAYPLQYSCSWRYVLSEDVALCKDKFVNYARRQAQVGDVLLTHHNPDEVMTFVCTPEFFEDTYERLPAHGMCLSETHPGEGPWWWSEATQDEIDELGYTMVVGATDRAPRLGDILLKAGSGMRFLLDPDWFEQHYQKIELSNAPAGSQLSRLKVLPDDDLGSEWRTARSMSTGNFVEARLVGCGQVELRENEDESFQMPAIDFNLFYKVLPDDDRPDLRELESGRPADRKEAKEWAEKLFEAWYARVPSTTMLVIPHSERARLREHIANALMEAGGHFDQV